MASEFGFCDSVFTFACDRLTFQFETGACAVAFVAFDEFEVSRLLAASADDDVAAGCVKALSASVLLAGVSAAKSVKKSYCLDIFAPQLLRKMTLAQGSLTELTDRTWIVASKPLAAGVTSRRTRPASNLLSA